MQKLQVDNNILSKHSSTCQKIRLLDKASTFDIIPSMSLSHQDDEMSLEFFLAKVEAD